MLFFFPIIGGPEQDNSSDNGLLRGGKSSLFEGGIRVPFAIQWPRKIKAGSQYTMPVISLDIFATVAANVAGIATPRNPLDGVDLIPYLQGKKTGAPHEYLFWRQFDQNRYAVVHESGMKALTNKDSSVNLYQLKNDIGEQTDISRSNTPMLIQLEIQRKKWESQMIAPAFLGLNQEELYNRQKKLP